MLLLLFQLLHSTPVGVNNNSLLLEKKSIKLLKRRNAELVSIAKKLEEKGLRTQKELDQLVSAHSLPYADVQGDRI